MRHACFISYRHSNQRLGIEFIQQFKAALAGELEQLLDADIYIDEDGLSPGVIFKKELAEELCQSACMIMIYTPRYFHREHTYCTREYAAMIEIEKSRLQKLSTPNKGLIIPVVFRNFEDLPGDIKDSRLCADFTTFSLAGRKMQRHPEFSTEIRRLAAYIHKRFRELEAYPTDDCTEFAFPGDDVIEELLKEYSPEPQLFPGEVEE